MTIHLLDTDREPSPYGTVIANCGEIVIFNRIAVSFDDGRVCGDCLSKHRQSPNTKAPLVFGIAVPQP